jgi:hypothetical protein
LGPISETKVQVAIEIQRGSVTVRRNQPSPQQDGRHPAPQLQRKGLLSRGSKCGMERRRIFFVPNATETLALLPPHFTDAAWDPYSRDLPIFVTFKQHRE